MRLLDKDGNEVMAGQKIKDFRGVDHEVLTPLTARQRVYTRPLGGVTKGHALEFYPHVFGFTVSED
jgi:hypothetical protein